MFSLLYTNTQNEERVEGTTRHDSVTLEVTVKDGVSTVKYWDVES